jgi:zinc protease
MRVQKAVIFTALLIAPIGVAHSQTVESVLAKYVAARGGKARIEAVKTQRTQAHIMIGDTKGTVIIDQSRPALMRMDMMILKNHYARGYDGTKGWQALMADTGGVQIMPPLDSRNFGIEADFDGPLVDPAAGHNKVALMGRALMDGKNTFKVQVVLNGGGGYIDYYYLNPTTYLPVVWEGTRLVNGQMLRFTTHFRAYKAFGGLQFPVGVETTTNGTPPQLTTIDNVELNPTLDPKEFKVPVFPARKAR